MTEYKANADIHSTQSMSDHDETYNDVTQFQFSLNISTTK